MFVEDCSSHADRESMEEAAIDCVQARDRADRRLRTGAGQPVVVVDWPLRAAVRREQSILAHEAEHPVPADAEAIEGAQAGPDLAVPLAARPNQGGRIAGSCVQKTPGGTDSRPAARRPR